ncbi:hypothetical protein [Mesorhizobium sp. M1312]|uniref:hypothetical protein n=1 Tax=unclassified Mesorhizobium TaxID=325217 RepID=UPI003336073B
MSVTVDKASKVNESWSVGRRVGGWFGMVPTGSGDWFPQTGSSCPGGSGCYRGEARLISTLPGQIAGTCNTELP